MTNNKSLYIGERVNPQLNKSYFIAYGQLSAKEAKEKQNCVYGNIYITSYSSQEEYNNKIEELKSNGFNVSIR